MQIEEFRWWRRVRSIERERFRILAIVGGGFTGLSAALHLAQVTCRGHAFTVPCFPSERTPTMTSIFQRVARRALLLASVATLTVCVTAHAQATFKVTTIPEEAASEQIRKFGPMVKYLERTLGIAAGETTADGRTIQVPVEIEVASEFRYREPPLEARLSSPSITPSTVMLAPPAV